MKEITLEIKDLFDFVSYKFGVDFVENEFVDLDALGLKVQIPNADNNFVDINGLIIKRDDLYETKFDNGKTLKSAAGHLISVEPFHEPENCLTRYTKDWEPGDDIPYLQTRCISNKKIEENATVYGISVVDDKHLYKDADGMIHHNTYTVRQAIERFGKDSGKKIHYSSGAMSPALSSVIPFFYYHRNNEIIILDDNDKCLMKSCDQAVQNIMKALLDPSALKKPVSIPTSSALTKLFNQQLEILSGMKESVETKKNKNGVRIDIDMEALKEGYFKISVDGVETDAVKINEATKLELSNIIKPTSKLNEAFDDEDEDLDEDGEALEDDGSAYEIEPSFIFNSSVIFISNLKLKDISPAVADRCECCEIALTLPQFMQRLETVLGGLCKGEAYSSRPQWLRDWGKQTAYTAFQALVEAFNTGTILFGKRVTIRRKLTFRLFEEMANEWCRLASSKAFRQAERNGVKLNLENKKAQATVADLITEQFIRSLIDKVNQKGSN